MFTFPRFQGFASPSLTSQLFAPLHPATLYHFNYVCIPSMILLIPYSFIMFPSFPHFPYFLVLPSLQTCNFHIQPSSIPLFCISAFLSCSITNSSCFPNVPNLSHFRRGRVPRFSLFWFHIAYFLIFSQAQCLTRYFPQIQDSQSSSSIYHFSISAFPKSSIPQLL